MTYKGLLKIAFCIRFKRLSLIMPGRKMLCIFNSGHPTGSDITRRNEVSDQLPNATKHGGAGAYKKIQKNEPFAGLARIAQREVEDRLLDAGVEGELMRDAVRLQVVSDLYYEAFTKSMQDQDFPQATAYLKVWAWVHNSAIRAWEATRKHKKPDNGEAEYQKLIDLYRVPGGENAPHN